ncbi:MAG: YdbL family protein [Akkermansiaceae bacterium]|nr:YdbL family protein [Akkermansiaceae bacterium]
MNRPLHLLLALAVLVCSAASASAESEAAIKARMLKRLPTIVSLAQRGAVGENNRGTLTPRGAMSGAESAAVRAENADRQAVYAIIAKKAGTSASVVGKQRAKQIRASAPKGTWVQNPDGSWKKV